LANISDFCLAVGTTNAVDLAKGYRAITNRNRISSSIEWTPSACSPGCGPMGNCTRKDNQCQCIPQFVGPSCQCSGRFFCSGKGACPRNGTCECNPGWSGKSCSIAPHSSITTRTAFQSDYIVQGKDIKFHWWFHVQLQSQRFDMVESDSMVVSFYFRYDRNILYKVTHPSCVRSSLGFKILKPFPTLAAPAYQGYFDCVPLGRTGNNCEKWYSTSIDMAPPTDGNNPLVVADPKVIYSDVDIPESNQIQLPVYLNAGVPIQFNTINESPFDPIVFEPPAFC